MEVHAHTHTERKKWHHYFWEFFMLFLAVTLGFLVENQREYMIEGHREKQYIRSFLSDLRSDTAQIRFLQAFRMTRIKELDTLMTLLKSQQLKENTSAFYFYAVSSQYNWKFLPNSGTLSQLKNAGGLRLIRKGNVVDSILHFDIRTQWVVDFENWERQRLADLTAYNKVVDESVVEQNTNYTYKGAPYTYRRPQGNPSLLSYAKNDLDQLYNRFEIEKRMHAVLISDFYELNDTICQLIDLIKKEYHLQ